MDLLDTLAGGGGMENVPVADIHGDMMNMPFFIAEEQNISLVPLRLVKRNRQAHFRLVDGIARQANSARLPNSAHEPRTIKAPSGHASP